MSLLIGLSTQQQAVPAQNRPADRSRSGLGEPSRQLYPFQVAAIGIPEMPFFVHSTPTSKLQVLKRKRFTTADRTARIQRSLAALNQPETLQLTAQEWHFFSEDPDLDDQ